MSESRIRVKATAKITSEGWRGILVIDRSGDRARKYGPPRISLDEAESDARLMLESFQRAIGREKEDGTLPLPGDEE